MTIIKSARGLSRLAAAAAVLIWLAAPVASQEESNDQFILFTSDRAFPSPAGVCGSCEDIYVMPPAGELPGVTNAIRLTSGGGVGPESYSSNGPEWSRTK